jgi:tetratricopeptide (TPR) repeat protein
MTLFGHLNTLESAGLVRLAQLEPDLEYLFRHALVQEAAYSTLLSTDRGRLHLAVGEAIERQYPDRIDEFAATLAHHFGAAGDEDKSVKYCSLAGEVALASYANREAENHFRCALGGDPDESRRADILSNLGEALYRQSRYKEAILTWREGIDLFRVLEAHDKIALLYGRAARATWHDGDTPQSLTLCQEGLEAVAHAPESPSIAFLMHETGRALYFNGMPDKALPICQRALAIAERLDAVDVQADTLTTLGILPDQPSEEVLGSLTRAVEIAEANNLLEIASRAHHNLGAKKSNLLGDQQAEHYHYMRAAELDRTRGHVKDELFNLVSAALILNSLGEFTEVEEILPVLENLQSTISESGPSRQAVHVVKFGLLLSQGKFKEALQILKIDQAEMRQRGELQGLYFTNMNLASLLLELHRLQGFDSLPKAEVNLTEAIELADRGVAEKSWPCYWLSIVYTFQGRFQEARQMLVVAEEAIEHPTFWNELNMTRAEAELAAAEQRWQDAFSNYESAVTILARKGLRLDWARALHEWAGAHIARGDPTDYERAKALYREALTLYEEMGTAYYADLVKEQLRTARMKTFATVLDHEQVVQEIAQAGRVQESFLPEETPEIPGWQISAMLKPARETSGDFYDFIQLPGDRLGFVVADVADKGMGAALYMATCRSLIRTYAGEHPDQPELALAKANRRILADTHGGLFITVFYGVLEPATGKIIYCNAGHNPPVLISPENPESHQALSRTGMPLGISEEASWEQGRVTFQSGDTLVAYTDGVTEAQNDRDEFYDEARLLEVARSKVGQSAQALQDALERDIDEFSGMAPQFDDITMMVVKRNNNEQIDINPEGQS